MQVSAITKSQWVKVLKTVCYVAASAVLGYLISLITQSPDMFGIWTPVVNVILVTLKQLFTSDDSSKPAEK